MGPLNPYGKDLKLNITITEHLKMHQLAILGIPPTWYWWSKSMTEAEDQGIIKLPTKTTTTL